VATWELAENAENVPAHILRPPVPPPRAHVRIEIRVSAPLDTFAPRAASSGRPLFGVPTPEGENRDESIERGGRILKGIHRRAFPIFEKVPKSSGAMRQRGKFSPSFRAGLIQAKWDRTHLHLLVAAGTAAGLNAVIRAGRLLPPSTAEGPCSAIKGKDMRTDFDDDEGGFAPLVTRGAAHRVNLGGPYSHDGIVAPRSKGLPR